MSDQVETKTHMDFLDHTFRNAECAISSLEATLFGVDPDHSWLLAKEAPNNFLA